MKDKVFLDTNILIYLANEDSSFHAVVKNRFKELAANSELWISRQVLREYAVVMSRSEIIEKSLTASKIVVTMIANTISLLFTLNVDDFKGIKEIEIITV